VAFSSRVLRSLTCALIDSPAGGRVPLVWLCWEPLWWWGGGPDGHRGPATETTLVVWQSRGVSGLHGGGREGGERVSGDEFLSGMDVFDSRCGRRLQKASAAAITAIV
jgi:hypothetical protein